MVRAIKCRRRSQKPGPLPPGGSDELGR